MSGTLVSMSHGYQAILIKFLKFLVLPRSEKIKKKLLMIEKRILILHSALHHEEAAYKRLR